MKPKRTVAVAVACGAASVAAFLLNSCSTVTRTVLAPPEIPGANGQGRNKEEALESLRGAIELILEDRSH